MLDNTVNEAGLFDFSTQNAFMVHYAQFFT